MNSKGNDIRYIKLILSFSFVMFSLLVNGKTLRETDTIAVSQATVLNEPDTVLQQEKVDAVMPKNISILTENTQRQDVKRIKTNYPNPKRAMWLSIALPGAGQVYNRKYWKLPLVYGGFVGCIYAIRWNNNNYKDYSNAYRDIMDDDPETKSYEKFLHLGTQITPENTSYYQNIFKKRKDKYRKWRDLSIFCLVGVYALSIIDAYVDASLAEFDISKDLSMRIAPTVLNSDLERHSIRSSAVGFNCSLNF